MTKRRAAGFTILDFLVVVVAVVGLVAFGLPFFARAKAPGCSRMRCVSNQKQIALAFRMWANDHAERLPMELHASEGGTRESVLTGVPTASFLIISNELNSPKILTCPKDFKRERTNQFEGLTFRNLSYFVGIDASEANPAAILLGDRNISPSLRIRSGLIESTASNQVHWTPHIHTNQGNIALADGSAQQTTSLGLRKALADSGLVTNRFAIP